MDVCEFSMMLGRYHDDELPPDQRRRVQLHLRECPPCATELEQIQAMSQALRASGLAAAPKASQQFLARLEALADQVEDTAVLRFVTRLTAAAAAILLAATLQWSFHQMNVTPAQPNVATPIALAPDEKMVIDPDSNVPTPGNDVSSVTETQLDGILPAVSGDRP
jgi:hypothetical protein